MYYKNKIKTLESIFGAKDIVLEPDSLIVDNRRYPIINDVIILNVRTEHTAEDIRYTFGEEWKSFDKILPEHKDEFSQYFDIVDLPKLRNSRLCDLGCGNGRWSYFLKDICKEIILVDFSDAIFTARKNLLGTDNCLFFMCDLKGLPFRDDFADLLFCLGVLHHLPTSALDEVRSLKRFAPTLLIYLYYSLDNRPAYFRLILKIVTFLRLSLCKIRSPIFRKIFSKSAAFLLYMPLIFLGRLLKPLRLSNYVPLYEAYHNKSIQRIEQDVYDRFFTRIEQRVSREDILRLRDTFTNIIVSKNKPYWHFLCQR